MRSLLIKAALMLLSLTLVVGLSEVTLRLAHYGEANQTPLRKLMDYDPLLGWRHKRNVSREVITGEYHTTVHYNAQGVRGADRPYSKPQNVSRIVVLGASFVDAVTVQQQDQMTEVLAAGLGPRFEVINLGVVAYGTDQDLLWLQTEGWKYQPDLVILAFSHNDVWQNASSYFEYTRVQKPVFVMDTDGNLALTNVPVPHFTPTLRDRSKLCDLIRTAVKPNHRLRWLGVKLGGNAARQEDAPPDAFVAYRRTEGAKLAKLWSITQALLRRMKQETEKHRAGLVVLYVPMKWELTAEDWNRFHFSAEYAPGEVARRLVGICQVEGIPCIEPSDRFREAAKHGLLYYLHDAHWNAAGQRLAGEILAEYVQSSWRGARP
jgi:lysophospholipase L1-like esterase